MDDYEEETITYLLDYLAEHNSTRLNQVEHELRPTG